MSQVHQLINTAFYPQLGPSAMVCHQKRLAEGEAVNHHLSPLPTKSKNLHPNTPAKFDSLLQVLDSEGPRKSRLPRSSSHSKNAGFAIYLQQPLLPKDFPCGSGVKNPPAKADVGDSVSIPGLGRCPGGGNGHSFQYSCLENSMDREACSPWGPQRVRPDRACTHENSTSKRPLEDHQKDKSKQGGQEVADREVVQPAGSLSAEAASQCPGLQEKSPSCLCST